ASESVSREIRQDSSRTRLFIRLVRRAAHKNLAAAGRVLRWACVVGSLDSDGSDMREERKTRSGTGLHGVPHEMLVEIQEWSKIGLQERDANGVQASSRCKTDAHRGTTSATEERFRTGLPASYGRLLTASTIADGCSSSTLPIH